MYLTQRGEMMAIKKNLSMPGTVVHVVAHACLSKFLTEIMLCILVHVVAHACLSKFLTEIMLCILVHVVAHACLSKFLIEIVD